MLDVRKVLLDVRADETVDIVEETDEKGPTLLILLNGIITGFLEVVPRILKLF